jgi:hypothetical protein
MEGKVLKIWVKPCYGRGRFRELEVFKWGVEGGLGVVKGFGYTLKWLPGSSMGWHA